MQQGDGAEPDTWGWVINKRGFRWPMSDGNKGVEWWKGRWRKTPEGDKKQGTGENTEGKKVEMESRHWKRNRQGLNRRRSQQKTSGRDAVSRLRGKLCTQSGKKQFPYYYYSISHRF